MKKPLAALFIWRKFVEVKQVDIDSVSPKKLQSHIKKVLKKRGVLVG
jgi:hypothetical protein